MQNFGGTTKELLFFSKKSQLYLVEDKVFVLEFYIIYIHSISIY